MAKRFPSENSGFDNFERSRTRVCIFPFVRLELKPKAVYHKNSLEINFYDAYFENVNIWVNDAEKIVSLAETASEKYGLNGMDALHIAAGIIAEADEFITTERATSPLNRVKEIKIISIN